MCHACVINDLDTLSAKGATVSVGAPKHKGAIGGPERIVAVA